MTRKRTGAQTAAGKLISAIQKEWGNELGDDTAQFTETVMDLAHELLQKRTPERMRILLKNRTLTEYLGELWVNHHPSTQPAIAALEKELND
ncbi:MAG: hypothetical protein FHP92_06405 [Denitromonas halophila]|nr:MAG: hypothetical protein FHP94_11280 [Denitromonas halophila]TVT71466.1 MAG: hypothetical protein FHP93_09940 [Denitromonas halophila]TVT76888.1 MAG: hypothetical protein FHP92_06405 [Denitromonas halophila]